MSTAEAALWAGSLLLSLCAIPAAWDAWRNKKCMISPYFLWLWGLGEVLCLGYAIAEWVPPLLVNYGCNLICIIILMLYNTKED